MRVVLILASALALAVTPAQAALVLEYIQVGSITAPLSNGPALATLTMTPGSFVFLQVALRDTIGSGPNAGQPGTVPWQTNGGAAGPGSLGLGFYFVQFDGVPNVAVNPAPILGANGNARLVDPTTYQTVINGSAPPAFTRIGGTYNNTFEPGAVPDPAAGNRIGLFNLRIQSLAAGSGVFRLRDPDPTLSQIANATLADAELGNGPGTGTVSSIDQVLFGPSSTNTFDLPVVVTPEPSGLALVGLAAVAWLRRAIPRRSALGFQPGSPG